MSNEKVCGNCKNFIKGTVEHSKTTSEMLSSINERGKDVDRCKETHYKVNKNTFCINGKFIAKTILLLITLYGAYSLLI